MGVELHHGDCLDVIIHIGAIDYKVVKVENLCADNEAIDGYYVHSASEIKLEATLSDPALRATLWHEVLHALLVHAGYDKHDEGHLSALAYGIMQVLKDNPEMAV